MSEFFDLACSISRANAAVAMANHAEMKRLQDRVLDLEAVLEHIRTVSTDPAAVVSAAAALGLK
jgi:hypothetical protein